MNQLFSQFVSMENIDAVADETGDQSSESLEGHILGVQVALEALETLGQIHLVLRTTEPSRQALRIAAIATENIRRDLNVAGLFSCALESSDGNAPATGIIDSIGRFISGIWEAIVKTFKYIWRKILTSGDEKEADDDIRKTKDLIQGLQKAKARSSQRQHDEHVTIKSLTEPLNFYNREITAKDFHQHIEKLGKIGAIVKGLSDASTSASAELSVTVDQLKAHGVDAGSLMSVSETRNKYQTFIVDHYTSDTFGPGEDAALSESDLARIDADSLCSLAGFIRGGKAFFYTKDAEPGEQDFGSVVIRNRQKDSDEVKIKTFNTDELINCLKLALDVREKLQDIGQHYEQRSSVMKRNQEKILSSLDDLIHNAALQTNPEAARLTIGYIRSVTKFLMLASVDLSNIFDMYKRSVVHANDLSLHMGNKELKDSQH